MAQRTDFDLEAMVDTHVLIFGCRAPRKTDSDGTRRLCRAANALLIAMPKVHMSPVVWVEFLRYLRPSESVGFQSLLARFHVVQLDGAIAERAAQLLAARSQQQAICKKCLNATASHVCPVCGTKVASQQRVADALIVAHADVTRRNLYSGDRGIHELKSLPANVRPRCQILDLPHPDGPLFERSK